MSSILIDGYPIDIALSAEYSRKSTVTKYPVEQGSAITDHIRPENPILKFEGVVSDTPTGAIANDVTRINPSGAETPSKDAFRRLTDMQDQSRVVTVEVPSLGKFDNMTITDLTRPVTSKDSKGLKFNVVFERIKFIENNRRTIVLSEFGGRTNYGLSLDKLIDGSHVLWRKGKPPGSSPATDPAGVIIGQEVLEIKKGKFYHTSNGKHLTPEELIDFNKDFARDSALSQRRTLARSEQKFGAGSKNDQRADAAIRYANAKHDHPNAKIDPAMFGL